MERKRRRRSGKKEEEKEGEREQEEKEYFEQEEAERRERARMREAVQKNGTGGGGGSKFAPDAEEDPMPPLLPASFSLSTGTVLINLTNEVRSLAVANSHLAARVCQNSKHIPIG